MSDFSPERELMLLMADVSRLAKRDFDERAKALSLTRAQWSILARLTRCQGVKQSELADLLELKPITLARHIDRLQSGGWVERRADVNDRRVWRLYLTEQAKPVLDQLQALGKETQQRTLRDIDESSRQLLLQALRTMKRNLTA
ncbi:MarR family winged helix-turn-helix transcriptional regulator [Idiomarina xiamenensis]|uniref:Transcriptional regulator, MarR family protein n=1 Tax=Idiomarina xiamenensis 10-D-4 TaxID=740709 RepID=K2K7R1_9GAMM|nr:MarR family transcriptional regulator [Idiomarina xiamenensis]EKE83668.1 transcriptional regulator, MarR family protein [Idiomarina xiamenensis 10-D-4]